MRVFWPSTGLTRSTGHVVGWRLEDTICVATIVDDWMSDRSISDGSVSYGQQLEPEIICRAVNHSHLDSLARDELAFCLDSNSLPIACTSGQIEIILYDPPDPARLRFLSIGPTSQTPSLRGSAEMAKQDSYTVYSTSQAAHMRDIIPLLNQVKDIQRRTHVTGAVRQKNSHATSNFSEVLTMAILPIKLFSETVLSVFNRDLRVLGFGFGPAREWSSTVDQLHRRLEWLLQVATAFSATLYDPTVSMARRSELYMKFWNTVWLIINDLIMGYCVRQSLLLLESEYKIAEQIPLIFSAYFVDAVNESLKWLDEWPVGLKLNAPLSQFSCTSLQLVVTRWSSFLSPVLQDNYQVIYMVLAHASLGGLTLWLALLSDVFRLITTHLYLGYRLTSTICIWQLRSLGGLFNLFRGKRWNVLRQRTDSYAYDVDQLFLGTLLFTVSAFLFPTVLAYAALFSTLRLLGLGVLVVLDEARRALNAFPLFELMLRVKESSRLPAGVYFDLTSMPQTITEREGRGSFSYCLQLRNSSRSFKDIVIPRNETTES
ncbi:N-acetylglucosaminyl transferase component-domain-containing protein [Naematelia encephala]|uniref:N-acetylglucosaminyl transferase component-domain-containing protein n=1 Tax=Naematelia encephala TaxID=71784 RepID=A0A1Y2B5J8_9TREE|nr:N-acetylglucosaminyl transferase component-domain-containing protein [Naematelia encephala]